jgi:hypothetical protein
LAGDDAPGAVLEIVDVGVTAVDGFSRIGHVSLGAASCFVALYCNGFQMLSLWTPPGQRATCPKVLRISYKGFDEL